MDATSNTPTVLVVLAHPDDESFPIGGRLAKYAAQGARVPLVCATRAKLLETIGVALMMGEGPASIYAARLFKPAKERTDASGQPVKPNFRLALLLAIPISMRKTSA